ncbi:MAG: DVUA0089 family protein [Pseudomonadota bacterium]
MKHLILSAACCAVLAGPVAAANFSFTGTLSEDDEVQFFDFAITTTSTVSFQSFQYGGGTQADGNVVSAGGFDSILSVFNVDTGELIDSNDDGDPALVDPTTFNAFDTFLELTLGVGNYTVAMSQFDNFANGDLGDGFERDDEGNFTEQYGCSNAMFCDVDGNNRTNEWAFDILGVDEATVIPNAVPLPAGLPLLLAGLAGFGLMARRKS